MYYIIINFGIYFIWIQMKRYENESATLKAAESQNKFFFQFTKNIWKKKNNMDTVFINKCSGLKKMYQ